MTNNALETLRVEDTILRTRQDTGEEFPVLIITGISMHTAQSGNQSFTKRRVSLPLNGFKLSEAKQLFPAGSVLEGFRIQAYHVPEYDWTTPDGEVRTDSTRYRLVPAGGEPTPQVQTEPREAKPAGPLEHAVFAATGRSNELEPQL